MSRVVRFAYAPPSGAWSPAPRSLGVSGWGWPAGSRRVDLYSRIRVRSSAASCVTDPKWIDLALVYLTLATSNQHGR